MLHPYLYFVTQKVTPKGIKNFVVEILKYWAFL